MNIAKTQNLLHNQRNIIDLMQGNKQIGEKLFVNDYNFTINAISMKNQQVNQNFNNFQCFVNIPILTETNLYDEQMRWIQSQSRFYDAEQHYKVDYQNNLQEDNKKQLKNETKNIPKNYGKAIISFIQKYEELVSQVTDIYNINYIEFLESLKSKKKSINTIADLRNLWVDQKYSKCIRILSNLFLRKYALHYIFNSRICNYTSHIKYRLRLRQAIQNPNSFKHIKDY